MSTFQQSTDAHVLPFIHGAPVNVASFAAANGIEIEVQMLLLRARQIFGDDVRVILERDAEIEDDLHLVFEAKYLAEVDEVLRKEDEWYECSVEVDPRAMRFIRLFVDIQS